MDGKNDRYANGWGSYRLDGFDGAGGWDSDPGDGSGGWDSQAEGRRGAAGSEPPENREDIEAPSPVLAEPAPPCGDAKAASPVSGTGTGELCGSPVLRRVFRAAAAFSLAAHGFLFANEFFSHDSVSYFAYSQWGLPFYTERGRFLIPLYDACKGDVAAPWLLGLLFTLWAALASYLFIRLLDLRNPAGQILSCGLVCTNTALTLTGATYVYCLDEYALALLLAAAAAYLFQWSGRVSFRRFPRARAAGVRHLLAVGWRRYGGAAAGLLALAASLALYQPYFTVTASLCLLSVLRRAVRGERPAALVLSGLRHLALLAAGFFLYYGLWTAACLLVGVEKQRLDSASLAPAGGALPGRGLWALVRDANADFFISLFRTGGVLGGLMAAVHALLLAFLLWRMVLLLSDWRLPVGSRVLLALGTCLLPTAFRSVSVLIPGDDHALTSFAGELLYFLPLLGMERTARRRPARPLRRAAAALLCLVLWQHIVFANQAYMKKDLEQNATLVLAGQIIGRIEAVEGYVPGETRVSFAGRLDDNRYLDQAREAFASLDGQVGLWHSFSATYNLGRYLTDYLHYPLLWDQSLRYGELPEVRAMPLYPAEGSVAMVRGTVVVKLSH